MLFFWKKIFFNLMLLGKLNEGLRFFWGKKAQKWPYLREKKSKIN
jgi:hypothetical protein